MCVGFCTREVVTCFQTKKNPVQYIAIYNQNCMPETILKGWAFTAFTEQYTVPVTCVLDLPFSLFRSNCVYILQSVQISSFPVVLRNFIFRLIPGNTAWKKIMLTENNNCLKQYIYIYIHTGCPRRNGQNFGRVFLMLNYTDITQNTYIQS